MSELFDEVDEEVRREQLKKLWDRYSIYIIAVALLIIAAVAGWRGYEYLEAQKAAEAGAAFDAALELAEQNKHVEAQAAFEKLATTAPAGYRMLARMRAAGLMLDTDSYPNMLQRLEASTKPEATFRHTARELLALSAWRANDVTAARQWLDMIASDGETPSAMRSRAEALQGLLPPVAKS